MHCLGCAGKSLLEAVFGLLCSKAPFLNANLMWMLLLQSIPPEVHQKVRYNVEHSYVGTFSCDCLFIVQECNQFLATHALRSKSRFKALDETGVIGLACRHEFPYRFYNLRHGERYVRS